MPNAKELMRPANATIAVDQSVREAWSRLRDTEDPVLIVLDGDEAIGHVHRDMLAELEMDRQDIAEEIIGNVMDTRLPTCSFDDSGSAIARRFRKSDVRLIAVIDHQQQMQGWIAREDVVDGDAEADAATDNGDAIDHPAVATPSNGLRVYSEKPRVPEEKKR